MRNKTVFLVFILLISSATITYLLLFHESEHVKGDKISFHLQIKKLEKEVQQLLQYNKNILLSLKNHTNYETVISKINKLDEGVHNTKPFWKLKETFLTKKMSERDIKKTIQDHYRTRNPQETEVETSPVSQSPIIAILVISCNRVTVKRCLDRLLKFRPNDQQFPIIVSQDCGHYQTSNVIKSYGKKIVHIQLPDQTDIEVPIKEKKFKGYFKIARHYGWALNETFKQGFQAVVVVEDDLDIAPDFFEYFLGTYPILKADPTLWCVSAWNDNGKSELIDSESTHLLYRSDFFPGLGWMLTKKLWIELSSKWPQSYWDDWIRQPEQRKNRACIRPEISRTRTFGKLGVSNGLFFEKHLQYIKLNEQFIPFSKLNLTFLIKEYYDVSFVNKVYKSEVVSYTDLINEKVGFDESVRISYYTRQSYKNTARLFGLMDDFKKQKGRLLQSMSGESRWFERLSWPKHRTCV
ncbi:alpha-1,3-mannosyl-glycoprotein 2-beta-N-acetylglucosaminyltransferase isoform X2 [Phymastichus coffea]|uniref:alpha-1,3-mannosyl-glycoprotein 2-beta-N-acetylglucosaminyltransferase isoform X2 n=1 Tax=Phymastichus coffea TaxID=108790 RepID=UPI00273A93E9|nr:alpha-1,3-mannosyl-glycoprotein 2-beta-N-acetylglucosaminyltransferase isoform X2 [Phymastichus coffea]